MRASVHSDSSQPDAGRLILNGVDLRNFLVAELAKSFGFAFKNRGSESLGDFRYGLCSRQFD